MRGKGSFEAGFKQGAIRGAAFGAIAAGVKIVLLGPASPPPPEIEQANRARGLGTYGPVYRSGGIVGLFKEGMVWGRNLMVKVGSNLWKHETAHYYQQLRIGYTTFYGRIGIEAIKYGYPDVYTVPGTLEYEAIHWPW
jgi:hypothetical protein